MVLHIFNLTSAAFMTKIRVVIFLQGMKKMSFKVLSIATLVFLMACSHTTVTSVWSDEQYTQVPIKSVLVIGISEVMRNRKMFESAMIVELEKHNVKAVASNQVMQGQKLEKENIVSTATENKLQTVLVTRLVGDKKDQVYRRRPAQFDSSDRYQEQWGTYYSQMYDYTRTGGDQETYDNYRLENSLFDVKGRKLIWSAATETFEPSNVSKEIKRLAETLVGKMKKSKMVK